jgi:hypothetical protein
LIDVGEDDLSDCRTRDETWELVDEKFREGRLRALKMWLEEIKKRFREGRIDEEEEQRKLERERQKEERREVSVKMI